MVTLRENGQLQGLVLSNWTVEVFGVVSWAILYFIRVPREERMMADEFGEEYKAYQKRAGRIIPFLGRLW